MSRLAFTFIFSGLAIATAAPASATVIVPGQTGATFSAIDASTRGALLATMTQAGSSATIAGTLVSAVYRNTFGTLDFYFQVFRTGGVNEIDAFNASAYAGYSVDALVDTSDFDGAGAFAAANNPFLADGVTPSGSTTTLGRSNDGQVMRVDFGRNGLSTTENSATYIFRTNAANFTTTGNATVSNSTSFNLLAYQAVGPSVPEPATWAMMFFGFGGMGYAMRRRSKAAVRIRFA